MELNDLTKYKNLVIENCLFFLPKLLLAIIILVVGFWVIKKVNSAAKTALEKAHIPSELSSFFSSFLDIALKCIVVLFAAGKLGFDASSLVAVVAAAGFAVGLALQGFLGNFASGITIVLFKPYKVGDWVEIGGQFGKVEEIQIFSTKLVTPGNKMLIMPNGKVTDTVITNFSTKGTILLELGISIPYGESFPRVKTIILDALKEVKGISQEIEPIVGIESFDSHNVKLTIRPAIHPDQYWVSRLEINQHIKFALHKHNVQVAYPEGVEIGEIGE